VFALLEMQASQYAIFRFALVVLYEQGFDAGFLLELGCVETLEEVATSVAEYARLDDKYTLYFSVTNIHNCI
jgi:hypothetical protein